jgi:hypothetical protein
MRRSGGLVAALVLLGACGGGGGGRDLDEAEYVEELSAICADTAADVQEVSGNLDSADLDEVADAAHDAQRIAENGLNDAEDLHRPEGSANAQELIEALAEQGDLYEAIAGAAEDGDSERVDQLRGELDAAAGAVADAASAANVDCEPEDIGPSEQFSDAADTSDLTDIAD